MGKKENEYKIHESQPETERHEQQNYVDENLLPMQQIEGGGPPKKIDLKSMPRPLRIFGYFFMGTIILMVLLSLFVTFFR
ncbi:hypothetical protein ABEV74_11500 [Paenibacillus cisolokensis]|uniref:hypothetical protein n=1 Tax=Paenibacillus cisolokensis TaxID=1658519 RepID=UPI003D2BC269